ncbi:MAG: hypothetical protein HY093_01460 [Candidatus Liptonbacteria bacterium]|nr:hypothetical protein [Candidatus Liptonbacteria bacterium]
MTTITIPKEIDKNKELVAIPRKAYEEFLVWQEKIGSIKTYTPTKAEIKAIEKSREEFRKGNYITWEALKNELANSRRSKSKKRNR